MQAIPLFSSETDLTRHQCYVAAMTVLATLAGALHTIAVGRGIIWTSKIRTGATDGVYIYINPLYFQGLANDLQRAFLIGHEVLHIVLGHMARGNLFKERGYFNHQLRWCHRTFNKAADYIINAMLIRMGLEMPEGGLLSDEFTATDIAEEVYVRILEEQDEEQDGDPGESGDDSDEDGDDSDEDTSPGDGESDGDDSSDDGESDDASDDGESGGNDQDGDPADDESGAGNPVFTDHDGHDDHLEPRYDGTPEEQERQEREDSAEIQREIDRAVDQAEKEGQDIGNLGGSGKQENSPVDPLDHDWEELLEAHLVARSRQGRDDWSRINRRKFTLLGAVAPSKKGSLNRLALIKDVSYSVSNHSLNVFDAKIAELLDQIQPESGTLVLHTHTAVERADDVYSGDEYLAAERPCGGGTYMSAGLEWMEENGESPDLTICFTDSDVWGNDLDQLAAAGVLLVIDTYESYVYAKNEILRSGIEFIVVNDRPA